MRFKKNFLCFFQVVQILLCTPQEEPLPFPNWFRVFKLIIRCSEIVAHYPHQPEMETEVKYYNWASRTLYALSTLENKRKWDGINPGINDENLPTLK